MPEKILYVVTGPTAVGKTAFSVALAKRLCTEIVSADSRQIYKEMEIGTAKPSHEDLSAVKHHFINTHTIHSDYNAGAYGRDVEILLADLFTTHDNVVMVGGSGLYIKAVLDGFDEIPDVPEHVRKALEDKFEQNGLGWLQEQLAQIDPDLYDNLDKQNPHRLMRALEVRIHTGQSIQNFRGQAKKQHPFKVVQIGLEMDRQALYKRIDERMDKMIEAGLFEEATKLYPLKHLNALQTVGYQEIFDFLDSKYDREEAVRLLKRNSRRYAKRQLTWFKRDANIQWFDASSPHESILLQMGIG